MWQKAKELNCDYIATGHYAKIEYDEKYKQKVLKKSNELAKDQSYVLYNLPQNIINHLLLPLGAFRNKSEIREIAKMNNLSVASKPDSEDICFVPDGDYKKFLEKNSSLKPKKGKIVNSRGIVLGIHSGLYKYTIGQRKGLGIASSKPLYVIGFNKKDNELIVGEEKELYKKEFWVTDVNLLLFDKIDKKLNVKVKTRYSSNEYNAGIVLFLKNC